MHEVGTFEFIYTMIKNMNSKFHLGIKNFITNFYKKLLNKDTCCKILVLKILICTYPSNFFKTETPSNKLSKLYG